MFWHYKLLIVNKGIRQLFITIENVNEGVCFQFISICLHLLMISLHLLGFPFIYCLFLHLLSVPSFTVFSFIYPLFLYLCYSPGSPIFLINPILDTKAVCQECMFYLTIDIIIYIRYIEKQNVAYPHSDLKIGNAAVHQIFQSWMLPHHPHLQKTLLLS